MSSNLFYKKELFMIYKGYKVDEMFVSDGHINWKETGNGKFIIASLKGKEYFLKKNVNFRKPDKSLGTVLRKEMGAEAERLEKKQAKLAELMKGLSFDKDHIAVEESNFWDLDDNLFVTVTRFLRGAYDNRSNFSVEPKEVKRDILVQMVSLLKKLHSVGVIHGDLKEPNFLFKKVGDRFDVYLIDFDASYPASEVPEFNAVPYTAGYESPEIVCYSNSENPEMSVLMTPATDIFTLGLIFHNIWSNHMPTSPLEKTSVGEALARGEENRPTFDKSLNDFIGDKYRATYLSLVNWMLTRMPDARPTADQVLDVLNDKASVPEECIIGKDVRSFEKLWLRDEGKAAFDKERLKERGVEFFRRNTEIGKGYLVGIDGKEEKLSIEEILERDLLEAQPIELCEPFPEHEIAFASYEVLKAKGALKIERIEKDNKYFVTLTSQETLFRSYKRLIEEGLAVPVIEEASHRFNEPWPEDEAEYAPESVLASKGIESIEPVMANEQQAYKINYNDGRPFRVVNSKTMFLLGLLRKKVA